MKNSKTLNYKNLLFVAIIALLIIPQTGIPIKVAVHKLLMSISSPSAFAKTAQIKLEPFDYKVVSVDGFSRDVGVGQGKVTFISYWATWCPPCIAELPSIEKLYADYGNKVDFVLITQEKPEVVQAFLDKRKINLPAVLPRMNTPEILFEKSIPTNYIIDKEGHIVVKEQGASDWNSRSIRAVLDALLSQ